MKETMSVKRHIPNTITCCNLFSGCIACVMAFKGAFDMAMLFIVLGATFDFFDGMVARLLHVSSPLGVQMDSLADDVTFGLAPATIVFCYMHDALYYPSYLGVFAEHLLCEQQKHLLQVGERYVLVYVKTFELVEEAVCTVADSLVTVYTARSDDADWGLARLHHAALYATGVCAQDDVGVCLDEECVLHVACGMILGEVH